MYGCDVWNTDRTISPLQTMGKAKARLLEEFVEIRERVRDAKKALHALNRESKTRREMMGRLMARVNALEAQVPVLRAQAQQKEREAEAIRRLAAENERELTRKFHRKALDLIREISSRARFKEEMDDLKLAAICEIL
jgi:hypothetical protein